MAGYGYYSGVGSSPYYVGQDSDQAGQTAGVQPAGVGGGGGMGPETPSEATPGAYGAAGYASLMPQWMQDYFDAKYAGQQGTGGLDTQRYLAGTGLSNLKKQYGEKTAMNPYFTTVGGIGKGFDPFTYDVVEKTTQDGRWEEYNPQFTYNRTTTQGKNPFTGEVKNTSYSYDQTYGPAYQSGGGGGYSGQDLRRDMLTGGLYSLNTKAVPAAINKAKKLW
jgi:hypothetical protein